mmetsp:Transcript_44092/g.86217  ORF Transcript_44092/g.86217 Transcript_44092/m.86217 type:complete len:200 (-) Transcript_44092:16-615(-)
MKSFAAFQRLGFGLDEGLGGALLDVVNKLFFGLPVRNLTRFLGNGADAAQCVTAAVFTTTALNVKLVTKLPTEVRCDDDEDAKAHQTKHKKDFTEGFVFLKEGSTNNLAIIVHFQTSSSRNENHVEGQKAKPRDQVQNEGRSVVHNIKSCHVLRKEVVRGQKGHAAGLGIVTKVQSSIFERLQRCVAVVVLVVVGHVVC